MDSEVIIVAVDASKEITDYALEWVFRNVTKAMDSLTILALLPCHRRSRPPSSANHLLSCRFPFFFEENGGGGHKNFCLLISRPAKEMGIWG